MRPTSLLPGLAEWGGCTQAVPQFGQCCHNIGARSSEQQARRLEAGYPMWSMKLQSMAYLVLVVLLKGLAACWDSFCPLRAAQVHRSKTLGLSVPKGGLDLCGLLCEALVLLLS